MCRVLLLAGVLLTLAVGAGCSAGITDPTVESDPYPTGSDVRNFSGTVTGAPDYSAPDYLVVEIDDVDHRIADVAPRTYDHCGRQYLGRPDVTLEARRVDAARGGGTPGFAT